MLTLWNPDGALVGTVLEFENGLMSGEVIAANG